MKLKADEEIKGKQLQTKLKRDMSDQIKELVASEEMLSRLNDETENKLIEEKDKYNKLRNEQIELAERLFLKRKQITEDSAYNKETEVTLN